jgi:polysaccharide pyruvyl transferase WcaK-like protein
MSNKGGELMLRAAVSELGADYRLAVESWIGPYQARAALGLYQRMSFRRLGPAADLPLRLAPRRIRARLGVVTGGEVAGILDAAGFAYGDQHGAEKTVRAAAAAARAKATGVPYVLLPQAFGPFTGERIRAAARRLVDDAVIAFARDGVSLEAVRNLGGRTDHVSLAPDFTIALDGAAASAHAGEAGGAPEDGDVAYIVPNVKVVRFGEPGIEHAYLEFLVEAIRAIERRGVRPVILLHESSEDAAIAETLRAAGGGGIAVVREEDPLVLKARIGRSRLVVGSRFHALVAGLSQAVPVVAVGWSHKYAELVGDWGVPEAIVALPATGGSAEAAVARGLDEPDRERTITSLRDAAERQRAATRAMWDRVRSVLPSTAAAGR